MVKLEIDLLYKHRFDFGYMPGRIGGLKDKIGFCKLKET